MQRFKSFQPRMGTAAGLSVPLFRAVLRSRKGTAPSAARTKAGGQCFGDGCASQPNRRDDQGGSAHITGLQLVHECGTGRPEC